MGNAYTKAGVDVNKGYETVERIKKHVKRTERLGVMGGLGSFGGAFDLSSLDYKEPVLISGTDGVGTKLLVATQMKNYRSIGIDCVAMCVNDVIAQGAEPLFFLDYIATGSANPEMLEQVVAGVCDGCQLAGAALIGGETAEMPGLYEAEEFDLAGFTVGIVEKKQMIDGSTISEGDVLIGLTASGIHSNGYSLVRKVFFQDHDFHRETQLPELDKTLGEELLIPTKIYVKPILALIEKQLIKGIAHITGGGFVENIPRMLPANLEAKITLGTWPELPIFKALEKYGNIPAHEMYEIFNMGIGMVVAVSKENVAQVLKELAVFDEAAYVIGDIVVGNEGKVHFKEAKL